MNRRDSLCGLGLLPLWLSGCASSAPPTRWYELRSAPPEEPLRAPGGDASVWELARTVRLPGALERDTLVVASGAASIEPLAGHRWVEPLRDSIPALLAADLSRLRGEGRVWSAPAPAGVSVTHRLRVEIDALVADADRRTLRLQARWWLSDASADAAPPRAAQAHIEVAVPGGSIDALASAHRTALWRLARRITGV